MSTATDWRREAPASVPAFTVFTKPIQKSLNDDREYRLIRLENGLEALLVHDSTTDKAAASLDVAVGHLSDPDDMPGLAHFCEHLLFMGTEPFPGENEYSQFLAKNNGGSNAYTNITNTNYYFSVANTALPGALARFAAFFHSPLFAPSGTSRELNAVDSEHKKNHQNDIWRMFQLNKHLTKPGHPWTKFGSGNRESLSQAAKDLLKKGLLEETPAVKRDSLAPSPVDSRVPSPTPSSSSELEADGGAIGRETRRRLVEWWSKEYCASRMHLCIIGKEPLDELAMMASELFSPIANRGVDPLPMFNDHPFGPDEKGTIVSAQTIMAFYAVEISFPLEWQAPLWQLDPAHFLAHLIGHEGHGSLHSYLKNKGWISDLSSGPQVLGRGFDMFRLTMYLTPEGFENYRSVILYTFKYLAMLRDSQFPAYLHDEIVTMSTARFRFKEKGRPDDYTSSVSAGMYRPFPKELMLSASPLTWPWKDNADPEAGERKVREYLENFRVNNGRVLLMAKGDDFKKLLPVEELKWETEPWYGTQYRVERFDDEYVKQANVPNDVPEFFLPKANEFIPTNLDVDKKEVAEPIKRPHLIRETPLSTLWHKKDDRFWVPRAYAIIDLRSPIACTSARTYMLNQLYADLVTDSLTEYSYDAAIAGVSYGFSAHRNGLFITMNGYSDKLPLLAEHVLEKGKSLVVKPERLAVIKEETKRSLENFLLTQANRLSDYNMRYLLTPESYTIEERLKELPSITTEDIQEFIPKLLKEVSMRILVNGNIYKDEAIKIAEMAERGVGVSLVPADELNERSLVLPEGCNLTWTSKLMNPNDVNFALTYYLRYGPTADQRLRATAGLLTQILKEPAFNILRTQEQLGYIVQCTGWSLPGGTEQGIRMIIQSEQTAEYCETRVEAFFDTMKTEIEEMTPEAFLEHKEGLEKKLREAHKNLGEETAVFTAQIDTGHLDFMRNDKDADMLAEVTKDDILALFMSKIHSSSKTRSKLSVHMLSQKPRPQQVSMAAAEAFEALVHDANTGVDAAAWKAALGDGPLSAVSLGQYWLKALEGKKEKETLLQAFPGLLEKYPLEVPKLATEIIQDTRAFQSSLALSEKPVAIVWGDLPVPKL